MAINITNDGIIEYYGNKAGYIQDDYAVVDTMFKREDIEGYLREQHGFQMIWKDGIYDRLLAGSPEKTVNCKMCRIYQLKPESDVRMRFISYQQLISKGYGEPDIANYRAVYDGDIGTNNLDEIYAKCNEAEMPDKYDGRSLSISDLIELYDECGSEFYYVDHTGFVKLGENLFKDRQAETVTKEQIELPPEKTLETKTADAANGEDIIGETFKFTI